MGALPVVKEQVLPQGIQQCADAFIEIPVVFFFLQAGKKGFHDGVVIGDAGRRKGLPDTELLQQFPEVIRGVLPALVAVKERSAGLSSPEKGGLKGPGHQGSVILAGSPGCQYLAGE